MKLFYYLINILMWIFFGVTSALFFMIALMIFAITLPFDPNRRVLQKFSAFWASLYLWINPFWSVTISGRENYDPKECYIIVSNHQSMADILVLYRTFFHFKWVSKASVFKAPFLGWNMKLNGYIPIERGDATSRERCMEHCRDWLRKGSSVLFFPEGTRSKGAELLPFKPGAFRLALEMKKNILPIAIRGSENALPKHSLFLIRRTKIHITILKPVAIAPYLEKDPIEATTILADSIRRQIHDVLA